MRAKLFVVLESVFLGLGALILIPSANPKPAANVTSASQTVAKTSRLPPNTATRSPWRSGNAPPAGMEKTSMASRPPTAKPMTCMARPPPTDSALRFNRSGREHQNHRSQIVRINDRGPYVEGRELDVSYQGETARF